MRKPTICIGENKDADQLRGTAKLISAFVFATRIVQFLFYLNPKFQASSYFLCLCKPVCVGPVRKPHCWFSHEAAQLLKNCFNLPGKHSGGLGDHCLFIWHVETLGPLKANPFLQEYLACLLYPKSHGVVTRPCVGGFGFVHQQVRKSFICFLLI